MAAGDRIGNWRGGFGSVGRDCPLANGIGEPGRASADAAGLPGRPVVFCGGAGRGRAPSDRPTLCRADVGLWSDGARSFVCECHTISAVPRSHRTQYADFPHCALLFASPQGLWDLSAFALTYILRLRSCKPARSVKSCPLRPPPGRPGRAAAPYRGQRPRRGSCDPTRAASGAGVRPRRVVEAFVDELDLGALGFEGVQPAAAGRPARTRLSRSRQAKKGLIVEFLLCGACVTTQANTVSWPHVRRRGLRCLS